MNTEPRGGGSKAALYTGRLLEDAGTRGLVWIWHRPPKPAVEGSNPSASVMVQFHDWLTV